MPNESTSRLSGVDTTCHVCEQNFGALTETEWLKEWQRHEQTHDHLEKVERNSCRPLPCIVCKFPGCFKIVVGPWNTKEKATLRCRRGHDLSKSEIEIKGLPWRWLKLEYPEIYSDLCKSEPNN